jgi:lysophospholipase L1-like esterase
VNAEVGGSERVAPRNEEVLRIAKSLGLEVIDLYSVSVENAQLHTSDGVHFTAEGYEALAEAVVDFIKERIKTQ